MYDIIIGKKSKNDQKTNEKQTKEESHYYYTC